MLVPDIPANGLVVFVKRGCETCAMVEPLLGDIARAGQSIVAFSQDDVTFPRSIPGIDDTSLERSFCFDIETVPTLIRFMAGREVARTFGWHRTEWQTITGLSSLGPDLPAMRPGCGSISREPGVHEQ